MRFSRVSSGSLAVLSRRAGNTFDALGPLGQLPFRPIGKAAFQAKGHARTPARASVVTSQPIIDIGQCAQLG